MSDLLIFIVLLLRPLKFPSGRGSCKIDQAYLTLDGLPIIKSSRQISVIVFELQDFQFR